MQVWDCVKLMQGGDFRKRDAGSGLTLRKRILGGDFGKITN